MNKEVYILDDLYANRDPRLYTECPTLRSERHGLKVIEEFPVCCAMRGRYNKDGKIKERRCNMREYTIRDDGCSNTLTTVLKDNYILEVSEK